jgi:hypothetical protein
MQNNLRVCFEKSIRKRRVIVDISEMTLGEVPPEF